MTKMIFIFLLFFSQFGFGDQGKDLIDLPPPTIENMRWYIPVNDWYSKDEYFIKGKYFKIEYGMQYVEERQDGTTIRRFDIYRDPLLKPSPLLSASASRSFYSEGKVICELFGAGEKKYSANYIECRDGGCAKNSNNDIENLVNPSFDLTLTIKKSNTESCPYRLDYVHVSRLLGSDSESFALFRFDKISPDKKSVEISVNGKPAYLDIRRCLFYTNTPSKACLIEDYKYSKYEENWLRLKKIQRDKSHANLNRAIKLITPCLKTKDVKCVEKYITRKGEADPMFIETEITPDVFKELEHCLSYNNLLPHLLATRGLKKACIFNESDGDKPLRGVTSIEALSTNGKFIEIR